MEVDVEKIKILNDGVLIKIVPIEEKTSKGIYVPESVIESNKKKSGGKGYKGQIIKFGKGVSEELREVVRLGDIVWLAPESIHCPRIVKDETEYLIVREEDILAKEGSI